jgi:hypothetical protein
MFATCKSLVSNLLSIWKSIPPPPGGFFFFFVGGGGGGGLRYRFTSPHDLGSTLPVCKNPQN